MADILHRILETKALEIAHGKRVRSEADWLDMAAEQSPPRGFARAIQTRLDEGKAAVIAELKKASPSKGLLRESFTPEEIAQQYSQGGATCLSVLTDTDYFQGAPEYLAKARNACALPVLRKDFIIDTYQVAQSRALGADAILLIAAALSPSQMIELELYATRLGMDVLVEVHDMAELNMALALKTILIGVNNRNLRTFETSLQVTIDLLPNMPKGRLVVSESGIHEPSDIHTLRSHGVHAFLIGESLMRAADPGLALSLLLQPLDS